MPDVLETLSALPHAVTPGQAGADVVAADVARGHHALSRQRRRRFAGLGAAVAAVAAVTVTITSQPAQLGRSAPSAAGGSTATTQTAKVRLVAYTGAQPTGFKVSTVPAGWKIISSDDYSFVVAPPGAPATEPTSNPGGGQRGHSSQVGSFVGRIAVMLQGMSELPSNAKATTVLINGNAGQLGLAAGGNTQTQARWLIFPDDGHKVLVQVPTSLGLTKAQIVSFAQGITVTSEAKAAGG
jgi:hypothetical protein